MWEWMSSSCFSIMNQSAVEIQQASSENDVSCSEFTQLSRLDQVWIILRDSRRTRPRRPAGSSILSHTLRALIVQRSWPLRPYLLFFTDESLNVVIRFLRRDVSSGLPSEWGHCSPSGGARPAPKAGTHLRERLWGVTVWRAKRSVCVKARGSTGKCRDGVSRETYLVFLFSEM